MTAGRPGRVKRFVVRSGMVGPEFAFEYFPLDLEREKGKWKIIYEADVRENLTISAAIEAYKAGERVKPVNKPERKLKPLAEILTIKRAKLKRGLGRIDNADDYYLPEEKDLP